MSYGPLSVFSTTIASGASTASAIDLTRGWKSIKLFVPTMSTAAAIWIDAAATSDGSYYPVFHPPINSGTVATNPYVISASVGSGGGIVDIPNGLQYLRPRTTAVISGGVAFKVICSD